MKMKLREKIYQDVTNMGVPETLPPFQSLINLAKKWTQLPLGRWWQKESWMSTRDLNTCPGTAKPEANFAYKWYHSSPGWHNIGNISAIAKKMSYCRDLKR